MDNTQVVLPPQADVVSQPVTPQIPITPPAPHKSRKPLLVILVIVVILGIILLATFYFLSQKNSSTVAVPSPTPNPVTISPTQNPFPTSTTAIQLILEKDKKTQIPNSDVFVTYLGSDVPNPECFDCSTTTDLVIEQGIQKNTLQYLCGGIAGTCTDKLSGFGYEVELVESSDISATVKVLKKQ